MFWLNAVAILRVTMKVVARLARFIGCTKGVALTVFGGKLRTLACGAPTRALPFNFVESSPLQFC